MRKRNTLILLMLFLIMVFSSCSEAETEVDTRVLYAHSSIGITKYIYEDGKLTEVKTLDPVTLNEAIVGADNLKHTYSYDENGILDGIVYQGQNLRIEYDENSFPKRAGGKNLYVNFTCNASGAIVKEEIYQNKKLVVENRYADDGTPVSSNYIDLGTIDYSFTEKVSSVTVTSGDETLFYEITIGDDGKPTMFSQTTNFATVITAWQYNNDGLVTVAAVQTTTTGSLREQYDIVYNDEGKMNNLFRSFVDQYDNLALNSETYYTYNSDGEVTISSSTTYNDDATVKNMVIIKYENDKKVNVIESEFEENAVASYVESEYTYDKNGNTLTLSKSSMTGDDTFVSGEIYEYRYDDAEKLTGLTVNYLGENREIKTKKVEEYVYDDNGFCATARMYLTDGESNLIERKTDVYERDDYGNIKMQLTSRYDSTDSLTGTTVVENLYNVKGKLLTSVTRNYDANGKEIKEK